MLEQRNDSLKSSSEQNQARLLQAEQDKVSRLVFLVFNESNKAVGWVLDVCGDRLPFSWKD